jgi:nucleotide-binding universal stress UspA family protein
MFNKMLLPTDGSENALKAARYMVKLVKAHPGVQVTLLHVYRVLAEFRTYDSPSPFGPGILETLKQMAQQALDKTVAVFEEAGLKVEAVSLEGDPGKDIAKFAAEGGYDHIVIGSRGAGLSALIFGSVAQSVLYFAQCPVIIIKS